MRRNLKKLKERVADIAKIKKQYTSRNNSMYIWFAYRAGPRKGEAYRIRLSGHDAGYLNPRIVRGLVGDFRSVNEATDAIRRWNTEKSVRKYKSIPKDVDAKIVRANLVSMRINELSNQTLEIFVEKGYTRPESGTLTEYARKLIAERVRMNARVDVFAVVDKTLEVADHILAKSRQTYL